VAGLPTYGNHALGAAITVIVLARFNAPFWADRCRRQVRGRPQSGLTYEQLQTELSVTEDPSFTEDLGEIVQHSRST
jgi:hypothetical protein